ncbi:hypothetical protein [Seleniivibrio woodruffii]|uniref:hypothetical protein n=1 Tax=Seleniivibrio woodruffii TaxID=1078050 RepID=UPI00240971B6|nr:hypothetical protein [Seleniivibrio woodruffii]
MEISFNPEEHVNSYTALFSGKQVTLDSLRRFIDTENRFGTHTDKKYIQQYGQLFRTLRDNLIVPNYEKFNLLPVFEELAALMRRSGTVLPPNPQGRQIIDGFKNSYDSNEPYWKLQLLRMETVLSSFCAEADRNYFLNKVLLLRSVDCFRSLEEVRLFAQCLRMLFPTPAEFMTAALKIFTPDYAKRGITEFKAGLMWITEISWTLAYKEAKEHMMLMDSWISIFHECIRLKNDEAVFYMHFPLSHVYLNNCHTQPEFKEFNDRVEIPFSDYIQQNMDRWNIKPVTKQNEKKRIGFVYDRLAGSSPVKLLLSLLHYMKNEPYELFVYDMAYIEKAVSRKEYIDEVLSAGAKYVNNHELTDSANGHYYSHFEKNKALRKKVIEDEIDVLIVTSNKSQAAFLCATRTAPQQIFWDHGNHEYDVAGLDSRICHFDDGYRNGFEFQRFDLKMLQKYLNEDEQMKKAAAAEIKKNLPPHSVVLGSIGRIMKLSDEYMEMVADILKANPDTIYLACGDGPIEEKKAKARALGVADRFIFTGWADAHVYGHVIDIYLNTFPLVGGESVNEFVSKGENKYVVTLY